MNISISLPTRNRPEHVRASVQSLCDLAADPELVEVLLYVDEDDALTPTQPWPEIATLGRFFALRGPRWGYSRAEHMWNALAELSKGQIIINWNDDARMLTRNWDKLLLEGPKDSIQYLRRDIFEKVDTTFPAVSRSIYKAMGQMCQEAYNDHYLERVSIAAGIDVYRDDIVITHHRLNDQTAKELAGYGHERGNSEEMKMRRAEDVEKILKYLKDKRK